MLLARLFVISPMWVVYFYHETYSGPVHERISLLAFLISLVVAYLLLCWWDSGRAPRSAVSVILRNMGLTYCVVWSFLLLFGGSWFFCYMISHATVWVLLFWQFVVHTIAHHFVYPYVDANYHNVRKAGWHPIWDGGSFNHDSELIKSGGFEEPTYTGFVPPADWRFQCPRCLVRVEHSFGVCWNCSYGSRPGDEREYYERWGS
jgi:hypothetical protein